MAHHAVRPPEWIDSAPLVVNEQIVIDVPPEQVWTRLVDHCSWPEWFDDLDRVEPHDGSTGVGGGRTVTVKRLAIVEEFTAWNPNEHFAFSVVESKLPILASLAESIRLQPVDGGGRCRVTYRQGVQGRRGVGWLMTALWKRAATGLPDALQNLKKLVEADA